MLSVKRFCFILSALVCITWGSSAQLLEGYWKGNFARTFFIIRHPASLELSINSYNDSVFTGSSHWLYSNGKYEHYKIIGKFIDRDSLVTFEETLIETNIKGVLESSYKMKLKKENNSWLLQGVWKDKNNRFKYFNFNKVWLQKQDTVLDETERQLSINNEPNSLGRRAIDIQKTLEITAPEKDSIEIAVYDNGEIDGDSISVYLNETLLINKQLISARPLSLYISLDKSVRFNKIKMVAENLGSIPPNTALMIITTKKKRYEIRLDSDLNKTAAVELLLIE